MKLKDILKEKKSSIVRRWFESVLETYHEDARGPFRKREAQFANPVGYTLAEGVEGLFDALLQGLIPDTVSAFLDGMIRIRAVQDFTPSQAVAFLFRLKTIIREELGDDVTGGQGMAAELAVLDSTIDDLALFAFDIYMKCREKIYDIKAQEARNMTFRLLQQANLIAGNKG